MNWPYELQIGWRYTRSGRASRRKSVLSFIPFVSMMGIAVGVAALIIVLSVMNGFQNDVRDRMLSVVAHVEVLGPDGGALADWRQVAAQALRHPEVRGAAPFVSAQALVSNGRTMAGTLVRGISPEEESQVTAFARQVGGGKASELVAGGWNIVLGSGLAEALGVRRGDKVTLMAPGGQITPAGVLPRLKQFTVVGILQTGHYQHDNSLVLVHIDDAARLFRVDGADLQLRLQDLHRAREVSRALQASLGDAAQVRDWTHTNQQWFSAVQVEKKMMSIILALVVAVASFNLVSMLVMTVTDKRADIAILRTLGASPRGIMAIFMMQGAVAGVIGTLVGTGLGLLAAFHIDAIVHGVERLLHQNVLGFITHMPSDPQRGDVIPIALMSLVLAFLATVYPSWRASRVQPAEALRYE